MADVASLPPWKRDLPAHLTQAQRNFRLYCKLRDEGEFLDWAATALFYSALHLSQACLLELAVNAFDAPRSHEQRDLFIRRKLGDMWEAYSFLQNLSTRARYHPGHRRPTPQQLRDYEASHFATITAALSRRGIQLPA